VFSFLAGGCAEPTVGRELRKSGRLRIEKTKREYFKSTCPICGGDGKADEFERRRDTVVEPTLVGSRVLSTRTGKLMIKIRLAVG
jgi:hypothetical protein